MTSIEDTVHNLERFYLTLTGRSAPAHDGPYAPIPPEKDPSQHVAEQIDRLLGVIGDLPTGMQAMPPTWVPAVSVWEGAESILIRVDLAGVPRDSVNVSLKQNVLLIEGARPPVALPESAKENYRLRASEIRFGRFQRQIMVPPGMAADGLSAQMKDGVLEIHLPRRVPTVAESRTVPVQ